MSYCFYVLIPQKILAFDFDFASPHAHENGLAGASTARALLSPIQLPSKTKGSNFPSLAALQGAVSRATRQPQTRNSSG